MNKQFNIILTRHSQAIHNRIKQKIQLNQNKINKYKNSQEYLLLKYNDEFFDREDINRQQIQNVLNQEVKKQIGLIIVSPLNRCIETAKQLKLSESVQIIIQPLLCSRITSAWSIGKSLRQKKFKYPQINFNFSDKQNIHWCIDILLKDSQNGFAKFYNQNKTQFGQNYEKLILQFVKQKKGQTYLSIIHRALKFKNKLQSIYLPLIKDKKVLIISHSNYLKVLTAKKIDYKGKARSDLLFEHMDLTFCSKQFLVDGKILVNINEKLEQNKENNQKIEIKLKIKKQKTLFKQRNILQAQQVQ